MTGGVAGVVADRRADPIVTLQRRAFGLRVSGTGIRLAAAVAGPAAALVLCSGPRQGDRPGCCRSDPNAGAARSSGFAFAVDWPAQEVLTWMDHVAATEWRTRTGSRMPRNSVLAGEWLRGHAESEVPADAWASALLMAGRLEEARCRIDALPRSTPAQLHRRLDLELAADAAGGRAIEMSAVDDAAARDTAADPVAVTVHLAFHASVAAASNGIDGLPILAPARPALGRLPAALILKLGLMRFRSALGLGFFRGLAAGRDSDRAGDRGRRRLVLEPSSAARSNPSSCLTRRAQKYGRVRFAGCDGPFVKGS